MPVAVGTRNIGKKDHPETVSKPGKTHYIVIASAFPFKVVLERDFNKLFRVFVIIFQEMTENVVASDLTKLQWIIMS